MRLFTTVLLPTLLLGATFFFPACGPNDATADTMPWDSLSEDQRRLAENALASFTLHEGLHVQQWAAEPRLINPTNIDVDERGRVWVCEAQNYRLFNNEFPARDAGDRILILEDTDGDGRADTTKVFYQGTDVNSALGVARLGNKVYVSASPHLLVFTDDNGDDVPDSKDTLFTGVEGLDHDHGLHAVVFGPDGRLYFNFGNEGKHLRTKDGKPLKDKYGNVIEDGESPYRQGMVFRCKEDGTELEVLGHNFRNNYEAALDSYGAIWQSDNDDDGNEGTRINFVMEYGNYGYQDEMTGAGWRVEYLGMPNEIPLQHWHLTDPGVVPNLLQTGAGSPTGMVVYEGDALPDAFRGEMIHSEPGKQVVRAYPVSGDGAGYKARIVPLLESKDPWFRPSDVAVAPDGSVFVADWYDAGVGGHRMVDIASGRLYRLHGAGREQYTLPALDLNTAEGAVQALRSPNQATRYLAYHKLKSLGAAAEAPLRILLDEPNSRMQARALWLLAAIPGKAQTYVEWALSSNDVNIRILALRMARLYLPEQTLTYVARTVKAPSAQIRREAAIALRHAAGDAAKAAELWTVLANQYDGQDRWYLEALGIAAALREEAFFRHWLRQAGDRLQTAAGRELVWRSRSAAALPLLFDYIKTSDDPGELARYYRALHFHPSSAREPYLLQSMEMADHPQKAAIVNYTLASLDADVLSRNARLRGRVEAVLPELRGTPAWLTVIRAGKIRSEMPLLLDSALVSKDPDYQKQAGNLLYDAGGKAFWEQAFRNAKTPERKAELLHLSGRVDVGASVEFLIDRYEDNNLSLSLRRKAAEALANTWGGMEFLMEKLESNMLSDQEAEAVATYLSKCWRDGIRNKAIAWLTEKKGGQKAVDVAALAARAGNALKGRYVFQNHCANCHRIDGEGVVFGPDLSGIGTKLAKSALYDAVINPSAGISFGYEGYNIKTKAGRNYNGYIESQDGQQLVLRQVGGTTETILLKDIATKEAMEQSLMTANLHQLMSEEELVNLVEFLSERKGGEGLSGR